MRVIQFGNILSASQDIQDRQIVRFGNCNIEIGCVLRFCNGTAGIRIYNFSVDPIHHIAVIIENFKFFSFL